MKQLLLISALFTTVSGFAQNQCGSPNALFNFDNAGTPKEIRRLGTSPEFPFLRNMATPKQVAAAIRRHNREKTAGMDQLNDMLMGIGFENGAADVTEANITMLTFPPGTQGNMGSGNYSTEYCVLTGDPGGYRSWKITSDKGCYMNILATCGNAFYPKTEKTTACMDLPVNLTGDMKEVTLNSGNQTVTNTDNVYVYYREKGRRRKHATDHTPGISERYHSRPLLLSSTANTQAVPQTYKVTVTPAENTVKVCPDSTVNLTANINVEKTSDYGGYYPAKANTHYRKVTKREYRKAARKMAKINRKEKRIKHLTGVQVNQCGMAMK